MISQKATLLCIYEILKEYSDEKHILSAESIREKLKKIYDVDMERRAIYRNIDALRSMGIEIEGYQENRQGYYLLDRQFELSEVRLLCDAVASSDLIGEENGKSIMKRMIDTQSIFQRRMLQKTVYVKNGKRVINKQLFYNIDTLNVAISQGCKVSSRIMEFGFDHKLKEKENSPVVFSPYVTLWAADNYYILAKCEGEDTIVHFPIDMLKDIAILEQGVDMFFGGLNPGQYAEKYIIQKGENKEHFELKCQSALWQDIVENFGTDAKVMRKYLCNEITVRIVAIPSKMRSWVLLHIEECEVIGPKKFLDEIQSTVIRAYKKYYK